jgi:hypothetical protein
MPNPCCELDQVLHKISEPGIFYCDFVLHKLYSTIDRLSVILGISKRTRENHYHARNFSIFIKNKFFPERYTQIFPKRSTQWIIPLSLTHK